MDARRPTIAVLSSDTPTVIDIAIAAKAAGLDLQCFADLPSLESELHDPEFQLVFLDISAEEMVSAVSRLRGAAPWVFVVPIARGCLPDIEFRVRSLGVLYYLTMPFEAGELSALLSLLRDDERGGTSEMEAAG